MNKMVTIFCMECNSIEFILCLVIKIHKKVINSQKGQIGSWIDYEIMLSVGAGSSNNFVRTILYIPFCPLPLCPRTNRRYYCDYYFRLQIHVIILLNF